MKRALHRFLLLYRFLLVALVGTVMTLVSAVLVPTMASAASQQPWDVVNPNSGKCLDVSNSGTDNLANVQLFTCNGTGAQKWQFIKLGQTSIGTAYKIVNPESQRCLDVFNNGVVDKTNVEIFDCNGQNNQEWIARPDGTLLDAQSTLPGNTFECLDIFGAGTADGTNVEIFQCHGGAAQTWNYRTPPVAPQGWFACSANPMTKTCGAPTDPINIELWEPRGNAFEDAIDTLAAAGWHETLCFNPLVGFNAGKGLQSPDHVMATDVGGMAGCGTGQRDHARIWANADNTAVYMAVSIEQVGCGLGHCVVDFNGGRDQAVSALSNFFPQSRFPFSFDYSPEYAGQSLQGVAFDGNVAIFRVG